MMDVTKLKRGDRRGDPARGFAVETIYPGLSLGTGDSGIGAIGRIDRATVAAGHIIRMHPHRDDEILTYVRAGRMLHRDTVGNEEETTATRLMMMNAGHTFQHEEVMLGPDPVEALQIFLRRTWPASNRGSNCTTSKTPSAAGLGAFSQDREVRHLSSKPRRGSLTLTFRRVPH